MGNTCSCINYNQAKDNAIPVEPSNIIDPLGKTTNPFTTSTITTTTTTNTTAKTAMTDLSSTSHNLPSHSIASSSASSTNMDPQCQVKQKISGSKLRQQRNSAFLNRTTIVIGVYGYFKSGKKSFIKRIIENKFDVNLDALVECTKVKKKIPFNGKTFEIDFILIPYSKSITRAVDFHLILYDVHNEESLQTAKNMINRELSPKVTFFENKDFKSNLLLIGNKCDNGTGSEYIKGEEFCKKNNYRYYEISIKDNIRLNEIIEDMLMIFDSITYASNQ